MRHCYRSIFLQRVQKYVAKEAENAPLVSTGAHSFSTSWTCYQYRKFCRNPSTIFFSYPANIGTHTHTNTLTGTQLCVALYLAWSEIRNKHHLEGNAVPAGYSHTNAHYAGGVNNYPNSNHTKYLAQVCDRFFGVLENFRRKFANLVAPPTDFHR